LWGFPIRFLQRLKLTTSKLASCWSLPRPIIKSHTEEKVDVTLCYRSSPKFWVPFNICATTESSNFKFGMQLGLAKAHHKNHNQRKKGAWSCARKYPTYLGFPLIFLPRCRLSVSGASCLTSGKGPRCIIHLFQRRTFPYVQHLNQIDRDPKFFWYAGFHVVFIWYCYFIN